MPNLYKGAFLVRDLSTALNSLAPRDKIMFLIKGTLAAGGTLDVDVSDILVDGAKPFFVALNNSGTVSSGSITLDNTLAGNSEATTFLVIADQKDLKMDG